MRISNHPPKPATGAYRSLYLGVVLAMGSLFVGCGANLSAGPAIHRAGPEGGRNLSTLTPSEMAFGNLTGNHNVSSHADLTPYLNPELPESAVVASAEPAKKPATVKMHKATAAPSEVVAETPATEEVAAAPEPIVLASLSDTQPAPLSNDAERYADREAQSQSQQEYMGGDVLVISASTIVIVLLITLLVLLLT